MSHLHCQQLHAKDCLKEKARKFKYPCYQISICIQFINFDILDQKHDCPETEPHSSWIDKIIVCSLIHRANWSTQTSNSLPLNEKSQLNDQITVTEKVKLCLSVTSALSLPASQKGTETPFWLYPIHQTTFTLMTIISYIKALWLMIPMISNYGPGDDHAGK